MSKTKKFLQLEQELAPYKTLMEKAMNSIMDQEISSYPIFVVHQHEVELGVPVVDKDEVAGSWSVNASSLEEFTYKRVIEEQRVEDFKKIYKDPKDFFCVFVLSELGANFIFVPKVSTH
ncbi:MAG: hypothetical protein AAGK97_08580 [Bacteroidota bacterium]